MKIKRLTYLFFLLGIALSHAASFTTFDELPKHKKQSIIDALSTEIRDSDILVFHLRKDEIFRNNGVIDEDIAITLGFHTMRVCCFLKGAPTVEHYGVGFLYEGDRFRSRKLILCGDGSLSRKSPYFRPAYHPSLYFDNLTRLAFVKRQLIPLKDCLIGGRSFHPELCKEVETLSGEAFIQKALSQQMVDF